MGHSQKEKAENHERVVRLAAALFRETGVDGIGVADLMKQAGLTHGGFYRHFGSREDLVAEAVEAALADGSQAARAMLKSLESTGKEDPKTAVKRRQALLGLLIDGYLSAAHRDNLASSCAVTTMAGDVGRGSARAREAYTRQVGMYLELLVRLIEAERHKARRAKAIAALSTLVGAVSLARAVSDPALSGEILKSAADELKAQLA